MSGIPFGLFVGLCFWLKNNITTGVYFAILTAIIYGIFISAILGSLHICSVSKMGYGLSEKTIAVKHTRYFDLMMTYEQAFSLCVMSVGLIRNSQLQHQNMKSGQIFARVLANKKTWEDFISFKIYPLSSERTQIEVMSKPAWAIQVIDNGQNLKNIERIVNFLTLFPEIPPSITNEE